MSLTHEQTRDLLEGYALWALDDYERAAVERHLADCAECRDSVRELDHVVAAIPESVMLRAPSARLRERILAAAEESGGVRRGRLRLPALRSVPALSLALLAVAAVSGGIAVRSQAELVTVRADRDRYLAIAEKISEGGRWWYMAGSAAFDGSGGTLIDPKRDARAFVLFHDLKVVPPGARYAIWLIRADGGWVRAANFTPSNDALQRVDVPLAVGDFVRCSVTVETRDAGPPQGTVAMESRVFGQ